MTGKAVSTLTPESSEAPRESRGDIGLFDPAAVAVVKRFASGMQAAIDEDTARNKTSSPELASLASRYVDIDLSEAVGMAVADGNRTALDHIERDIRSLAASVLSQAEGTPRK